MKHFVKGSTLSYRPAEYSGQLINHLVSKLCHQPDCSIKCKDDKIIIHFPDNICYEREDRWDSPEDYSVTSLMAYLNKFNLLRALNAVNGVEGLILYSRTYGKVVIESISSPAYPYPINCLGRDIKGDEIRISYSILGTTDLSIDSECDLFPSSTNTDWKCFVPSWVTYEFKLGDIVAFRVAGSLSWSVGVIRDSNLSLGLAKDVIVVEIIPIEIFNTKTMSPKIKYTW